MTALGLPDPESLSLEAQIAQLIVVRASGHLFDHQRRYPQWEMNHRNLQRAVAEFGVGGVILLGGSAAEVGLRSQQLQSWASVPLLIAADIEEGVGQRFGGATHFPPPMALAAIAEQDFAVACTCAEQMGAVTAQEAIALGLNWMLAPVVDVNNNADNPVINVRAFGSTPHYVEHLTRAFLQGARQFPILTTAKHFPGHGDTAIDSHLHLPEIPHSRSRLEAVEFVPFRGAIAQGVDAVMTAHLRVPALDSAHPATLSFPMLTGLLRQDWGFEGLVVTDALIMGAIARHYGPYEAAVLAIEAGADVLLMPADLEGTLRAVAEAVKTGRIAPERILASVERLWQAKQKVIGSLGTPPESCHAWEHVPPPPMQIEEVATPEARQSLTTILQGSRRVCGAIPSGSESEVRRTIIIVDDLLNAEYLSAQSAAIAIPTQLGYAVQVMDDQYCSPSTDHLTATSQPTLLQIFSRGNPFRGRAGLSEYATQCFEALVAKRCLLGLVIYGSPYVLQELLKPLPATLPYGFSFGQMPEAQAGLLSHLLPTSTTVDGGAFTD